MSELTSCNYDTLESMRSRYGYDNVRVVMVSGAFRYQVEVKEAAPVEAGSLPKVINLNPAVWVPHAWFMELTDRCIC